MLDAISSVPFDLIEYLLQSGNTGLTNTTLLKIFRLPRIWKLLRMVRLFKVMKIYMSHPLINEMSD